MVIKRGHAVIAAVVVGVSVLVWVLARGPALGPEKQIQLLIDESIEDAEEGDVGDLMDRVSTSYQGEGGDRAELRSYLTGLLFRGGIDVKVLTQHIALGGESARVEMELILVRGGMRGAAEGNFGSRAVSIDLVREDGDWKIVGSHVD